jgi:branched-chain amino acid transport system ATP-binding protein
MKGLEINQLHVKFSGVVAVKNLSFNIQPGEVVGLIGPNGAGKTTVINCISRLVNPASGSIKLDGVDLLRLPPHSLRPLGVSRTFQDLGLFSGLTVMDNFLVGQHANGKANIFSAFFRGSQVRKEEQEFKSNAWRKMELMRRVRVDSEKSQEALGFPDQKGTGGFPDLLDVQDIFVGMLPFGAAKRVDFGRAIVSNPKLLLLDEPAAGMRAADLDEIAGFIRRMRDEFGTAILLIEHHRGLVTRVCDRIVVMNFGEKIAEDIPAQIIQNPIVINAYLGDSTTAPSQEVPKDSESREVSLEPILEVKNIDVYYGQVEAISGVSISVPRKAIVAVLGANGAGKSSLLKAISGIEPIKAGEIWLNGEIIHRPNDRLGPERAVRKGVIQVSEGRQLFPELTVRENLKMGSYALNKFDKKLFDSVLDLFPQLKQKLKVRACDLSGGEQQMLAIGQALVAKPYLLLLDEPSLGLAPKIVHELFQKIKYINRTFGCAILIVEQNVKMALELSSFAYVLEMGKIVKADESFKLMYDEEIKHAYLGH